MNKDDIIAPELEPAIVVQEEQDEELIEIENEAVKEEQAVASVIDHKGWQTLVSQIDTDIKSYSDITSLNSFKGSPEELAVVVRSNATIADYLKGFKRRVENAAETRK